MTVRVEHIGDATLYLGDCREIIPSLGSIDLVVTDAPYRVSKGGFAANLQLEGGFGGWMKDYGNQGAIVVCDIDWADWIPLVFSALKEDSHAYFMSNGKSLFAAHTAALASGFDLHTVLVWDKKTALPNKYYQNITEFALFLKKGRAKTINYPASKNIVSIFQRDDSCHPTEKPVQLMELYVSNSSQRGDLILDPFMGSGTTGVATANLGRKFIGIEIVPKFFDIACRRVAAAYKRPRLFSDDVNDPVQLNILGGAA